MWEEYRYDPLGRRVMVRRNTDGLCNQPDQVQCASHITRFVWWGDNLLWELRAQGGTGANLEAETSAGVLYGRVSYFHAGGIDRPLVITKQGRPSVIPHQDWRGQFILGTYPNGQRSDCTGGQTTGCELINWPGHRTTAWHQEAKAPDIRTWYGSLVDGMRDGTGQMYMRNRYYDPRTGQFTQPDPIGLAGGLNSYGFAAGDPVSYSDPYGLSATTCPPCFHPAEYIGRKMQAAKDAAIEVGGRIGNAAMKTANAVLFVAAVASPVPGDEAVAGVTLFRAVGQAEARQIARTGAFEAGPNSLAGKWFATTADDAAKWRAKFYPDQAFHIVQARVSQESSRAMMHVKKLDNIGPAVYAELEQLAGAAIRLVR